MIQVLERHVSKTADITPGVKTMSREVGAARLESYSGATNAITRAFTNAASKRVALVKKTMDTRMLHVMLGDC